MVFRESVVKKGKISIEIYTVLILFPALLRRKEVYRIRAQLTPRALSIYMYGEPLTVLIHTAIRGDAWGTIFPPFVSITLFPEAD